MTTTIGYTYGIYNHEGELLANRYVHIQTNNFYSLEWQSENTHIQLKYAVGFDGFMDYHLELKSEQSENLEDKFKEIYLKLQELELIKNEN